MTWADLLERIARWENLHTEFKQELVPPDALAASLVAFANTDGGQLILGVSESRQIVGVEDPDKITRHIDNAARNNCEPTVTVLQEVLRQEERTGGPQVVVVRVPKGDTRPYRTRRGVYYIRTTSGRRQASREELLRLFQATRSLHYDETPLLSLSVRDLNLEAFARYLETTRQPDPPDDHLTQLRTWKLLANSHPTLAGIVLFGRDPQRHLPFAQINAARFPGNDSSEEPSDRKDLTGRLLEVIDQAERFLDLHLRTPHRIRGFEPEPQPELPKEALREAIVNAVAHRDYTVQGPIRLFILADRVEIHTPGKPPNTVDEGAMRTGAHVVRNPWIYARLADAGLSTGAGTGVRRMIRLVREAIGGEVEIRITDFEVLFTIPRRHGQS